MELEAEKLRCLLFIGEEKTVANWSEKSVDYMHTKNRRAKLLALDASSGETKYHLQAEVVECLDKRSIKMLKPKSRGNGSEERKRLTAHLSISESLGLTKTLEQETFISLEPIRR